MTMTTVAVAPGSLGAPPAMLAPKRYHLQQGMSPNSPSSLAGKNYDTLSKGKKSWSVRLGLSRQSQASEDPGKVWGTISGGSALSRQMLYGDPWLYGTVRSQRGAHEPRGFLTPPPPGAPVLIVCSCPEFLSGTTRKLGNCRKCGGHRLAGVPLGGTCRVTPTSSRSRPSLAGVLRSSVDDPYDLMRRSRLVEPRSRARSISPHRQPAQRDSRSQSVVRSALAPKDRKGTTEGVSRSEWFDTEVNYDETNTGRKGRTSFQAASGGDGWLREESSSSEVSNRVIPGRIVRVPKRAKNVHSDWLDASSSATASRTAETAIQRKSSEADWNEASSPTAGGDSRKSILECNVNPYLLVKKQLRDEDDLSDDLSDNALELEDARSANVASSSTLFDPSKVKSIERIPNRSAVAAIGGQRIRVFNEPRERVSEGEEEEEEVVETAPATRIPLPKVSPKRPPRKQKDVRGNAKRSILKRGKPDGGKRKSVLFNIDNVILAPEKMEISSSRRTSRSSIASSTRESELEELGVANATAEEFQQQQQQQQQQQSEKRKFITIPNIKDPKRMERSRISDAKSASETRSVPPVEKIKIDKFVPSQKSTASHRRTPRGQKPPEKSVRCETTPPRSPEVAPDLPERLSVQRPSSPPPSQPERTANGEESAEKTTKKPSESRAEAPVRLEDETELEIEIEELKDRLPEIAVDEKDLIGKAEANLRRSSLKRSQSDRTSAKPELSAGDVLFADTMRLSVRRRHKEEHPSDAQKPPTTRTPSGAGESAATTKTVDGTVKEVARDEEEEEEEASSEYGGSMQAPEKTSELSEKEAEPPPPTREPPYDGFLRSNSEHFRKMRPTSWSPPPGKHKHATQNRSSDPGSIGSDNRSSRSRIVAKCEDERRKDQAVGSLAARRGGGAFGAAGLSTIEIGSGRAENVCKITVSPLASPLVHRLQIGSEAPKGGRRTSIMINGDQGLSGAESSSNNKVTISVGGEDSVCNPTVISVNSADSSPKIQSFAESNRTLVILDDYGSNIVVESPKEEKGCVAKGPFPEKPEAGFFGRPGEERTRFEEKSVAEAKGASRDESSRRTAAPSPQDDAAATNREAKASSGSAKVAEKWSSLSKEAVISKLLEDSLKKARENGEILDDTSGEAILKILKQTLLKSKEYESSESTLEPESNYSRSSSLNSEADFVSTNLFLEENPYEVIKEPIYEEIPDEPPPLPSSPPPTEDYLKERMYFGDEYKNAFYKVNSGQFLRSYFPTGEDFFKKPTAEELGSPEAYLSKSPEDFFKKASADENLSTKFELLNFLMDSKERTDPVEEEDEEEEEEEEVEDTEGELEALYEQKETSLGDLSSKSSQISNVSDSSEECNVILTSSPETLKTRTVDIERTDSGVGSESSQASSGRGAGRRRRGENASSGPGSLLGGIPQVASRDTKLCEDCEQRLDPLITDSGVVYAPFVCRKCSKKRAERKEIIMEIVETEQKYGRDLQIILEEFYRPMLRAGLLTQEQLSAIFLNVEELLEHNIVLAEKLRDAVEFAQESGDEDLLTVDVGKIFLESERMLHVFESYCTRQGSASLLLQNLEKEKELLRIFLKVSQMENTVLRRMNLNSFLMVPVQRVTKYPLLLTRLMKATPSVRSDIQEAKKRLKQSQTNIELHLEHMNAEAKDVTSTKLWRRISMIQNGRRTTGEQDMVNIKLRKMAVEILEWAHEEARFVLEGRLLVAQPTDNNWRRGRTVKLAPVTAMLVTNGKPNTEFLDFTDDSLFPRQIGIKEATLLLVKEKIGRYSLLREPLCLDKCIVCCETDLEDYFEIQELSSKETFIFKAEDGVRTKRWCRTLQAHAQSLGAWRRRRGALPNIMICGVARN